ncbi:MAG: DUF3592 domain-containing protein [Bryobacteraceae bacterium]
MNRFIIIFSALVMGAVALSGLYLFIKGIHRIYLATESAKWPTTAGTVVGSETTRTVSDEGDRSESVSFSTNTLIRYEVNGQEYFTDVLYFGQTVGSSDKSEAALQRLQFPANKPVTISYNPANPATGVLKPGLHAEAFWLPGAALAFLLPAILCLMIAPKMMRSGSTPPNTPSFADSVHNAMEAARRGEAPPDAPIAPPAQAGDIVMPMAAAFMGAVACGLGILALTSGFQRIWHGSASQGWPTTQGTVIFANKGGGDNGEDKPDDSTDSASAARFVYQYEVAGTRHFSNLRRFAAIEGGSEIEQVASKYRQGAAVKVSYFPADPDVAVLEPGNAPDALWLPAIGAVLLFFSLAIFIWVVPRLAK